MFTCIYPGSFDPPTNGHMDLITRLSRLYDRVVVCVMQNPDKHALFTDEERCALLEEACAALPNVTVRAGEGFTVDVAKEEGALVMARGLRSEQDFSYEAQLAKTNRYLAPSIETVFFLSGSGMDGVSSSHVRAIVALGGPVAPLVPPCVLKALQEKNAPQA